MRRHMQEFADTMGKLPIEALDEVEEALLYDKHALELKAKHSKHDDRREKAERQLSWVLEKLAIVKKAKASLLGGVLIPHEGRDDGR